MPWNVANTTAAPKQDLDYSWMDSLTKAIGEKNDVSVASKALSEADKYAREHKKKMLESRFRAGQLLGTGGYDLSTGEKKSIDPETLQQKLDAGAYVDGDGNLHDSEAAYGVYTNDKVQRDLNRENARQVTQVATSVDDVRARSRKALEDQLDKLGVDADAKAFALRNWDEGNADYDSLNAWSAKTPSKSKKFGKLGTMMKNLRENIDKAATGGGQAMSEKMSTGSYDKTKGITEDWLENIVKGNIEKDLPEPDVMNQARLEYLQQHAGERLAKLFAGGKDLAGGEMEGLQKLIEAQGKRMDDGQMRRDLSLNTLAGQSMAVEGRRESASADRDLKKQIADARISLGRAKLESDRWIAQLRANTSLTTNSVNSLTNISTSLLTSGKIVLAQSLDGAMSLVKEVMGSSPVLEQQRAANALHSWAQRFPAISPSTGKVSKTVEKGKKGFFGFGSTPDKEITTLDPGGVTSPEEIIRLSSGSISGGSKGASKKRKDRGKAPF